MSETIITKDKISIDSEKHIFIVISKIGNEYEIQDKEGRLIHITSDDKYVEREVICLWETQADAIPDEVKLVAEKASKADDDVLQSRKSENDSDLKKDNAALATESASPSEDITIHTVSSQRNRKTTKSGDIRDTEPSISNNNVVSEKTTRTKENAPTDVNSSSSKHSNINNKSNEKEGKKESKAKCTRQEDEKKQNKDIEVPQLFSDIEKDKKVLTYLEKAYKLGFPKGCFYLIDLNNINSIFAVYEMLSDLYKTKQIDKNEIDIVLRNMPTNTVFSWKTSRLIIDDLLNEERNETIEKIHERGIVYYKIAYDKLPERYIVTSNKKRKK